MHCEFSLTEAAPFFFFCYFSSFWLPTYHWCCCCCCFCGDYAFMLGFGMFYLFWKLLKWHKQQQGWDLPMAPNGQLWQCWSFILTRFVRNNSRARWIYKEKERERGRGRAERVEGAAAVGVCVAIGAHCCWTYLIIAFHFVLGKRRKLNANLHDTKSRERAWGRGTERERGNLEETTATIMPTSSQE